MSDKDQKLIRRKDWALLAGQVIAIAGALGIVGKIYVIANTVELTAATVKEASPIIANHTTRLAVVENELPQILDQLKSINRKLDRQDGRRDRP